MDDDPVNIQLMIGFWIFFILLSCILNGFVIVSIILLYVKKPLVRLGSPKLFVILVCCMLQFVYAAGPSSVAVHINRVGGSAEVEPSFTCEGVLSLHLVSFMLKAIVILLVGAVVSVEGLRLQRFVSLTPRVYMAVAVVLVVLSVLFGFVVMIPVFFFRYLQDESKPCFSVANTVYVDITGKEGIKLMAIIDFIVPHCLVFMACLLLLIAYFTRSSGSRPGVYAQISFSPRLSPAASGSGIRNADNPALATNAVISGPTTGTEHSAGLATNSDTLQLESGLPDQTIHSHTGTSQLVHSSSEEDGRFPWYVVLAALVSFVFHFIRFFQQYTDLRFPRQEGMRLWVAGRLLLELKGVFLPCCWLLAKDVRSVWSCCSCRQTSARSGIMMSPQQAGQENVAMERL